MRSGIYLLAVLLWHLGALLGWCLDRDTLAALMGNLLAILAVSISSITTRAFLCIGGSTLLLIGCRINSLALLFIAGGAFSLVAGLIGCAALLLIRSGTLLLIRGATLLLIGGRTLLIIAGGVRCLKHSSASWCVTSLASQGETDHHKLTKKSQN